MGKNPNRAAAAARAAEMRAEAARKEKQRKQMITAVVAVVVVVIAVVVGVVIANRPKAAPPVADASATTALAKLTKLPAATLDTAAAPAQGAPEKLEGGTALTEDGKPKVLYVGAEYCPYCAMERWPLIAALGRFGTFEGLKATTSATNESIPDIPTWSFVGSTYKSDYLAFEGVETQTREFKPLQSLEGENKSLFEKFNPQGSIPWVTFGGTHGAVGASVDPEVFRDATYDSLIAGIQDPASRVGQTIDPAINVFTAQICTLTDNQPSDVCTSKGVTAASALLAK